MQDVDIPALHSVSHFDYEILIFLKVGTEKLIDSICGNNVFSSEKVNFAPPIPF